VFPITDFSGQAMLEFVRYEFEQPKFDVDECQQRGMTFAAPLKVTLRLIVFESIRTPSRSRSRTSRSRTSTWATCRS
jgi:DNA-directed RNA polymerase beta subunit